MEKLNIKKTCETDYDSGFNHVESYSYKQELILPSNFYLYNNFIKRALDLFLAGFLFVLTLPVFLITSLLIIIDSGFPVFFIQKRKGQNGKNFLIYKFRTMSNHHRNIDDGNVFVNSNGHLLENNDRQRVTKIGKFLRKSSIDEIPQLINVIKGEMSLVGPRPLPILQCLNDSFSEFAHSRYLVKPGLTGLWQISARSSYCTTYDMLEYDLKYIKNLGLASDFTIMMKTIPAIIKHFITNS